MAHLLIGYKRALKILKYSNWLLIYEPVIVRIIIVVDILNIDFVK